MDTFAFFGFVGKEEEEEEEEEEEVPVESSGLHT
jgi:hypothetical protein